MASVPEVVSGRNERSILHFYCQGGYIVCAAVGATRGADGSNDNCMQPFGRKAVVVVVKVQLSAAVRWLIWCLWRVMANTLCYFLCFNFNCK